MADLAMREEWRVVQAFPAYEVSSEGVIRRRVPHHRCPNAMPAGYVVSQWIYRRVVKRKDGKLTDLSRPAVSLWSGKGKPKNRFVNAVVCEAFHGPRPTPEHQSAHNDGDPFNNRESNLRWATPSENQMDRVAHDTHNKGERHGLSKFSDADAARIVAGLRRGERAKGLAERYRVSVTTINRIRRGETWLHIPR